MKGHAAWPLKTKGRINMNLIGIIILIALSLNLLLNILAEVLNLRRQTSEPPAGFEAVYSPEKYRRSQAYLKTRTRFGCSVALFDLALLLLFWLTGGFDFLDQWVRQWSYGPVLSGMLYIGIILGAKSLCGQPFSLYSMFVIEARFGFNTATLGTFVADRFKGLLLAIVIGGPVLAGVLAFFEYAGSNAWWLCWLAVTLFILGLQYIAPTWIMPLFNKFEPLEEGQLKESILALAKRADYPLKNVLAMDGSRRSTKSNAFFTGFGKNKRIALFDKLIDQHTIPEMIAVLAHEIGHFKRHHIKQMLAASILQMGLLLLLLSFCLSFQGLYDAFFLTHPSVYTGILVFALLFAPLDFFLGLVMHSLSRRNEYEADRLPWRSPAIRRL